MTITATSSSGSPPYGWHIVVYFEAADLRERWDLFTSLPTDVVVDHMGRPDVTKPVDGPEFAEFLDFMKRPERLGQGDLPGAADRHRTAL